MHDQNSEPVDIPVDYYLKNFHFLVDWVTARYSDLLNEDEQQFIVKFKKLDKNSQCLLVRLASRKGSLFRRDKLHYPEITCIDTAAQQLFQLDLIHTNPLLPVNTLASALTKAELLVLFAESLRSHKLKRKDALLDELASLSPATKNWQEWTHNQFGPIFYCDHHIIISNLLLLFFGNAYQDLSEFVLQDLGLLRYENYEIDHQHRLFKTRGELEQYQHLIELRKQLEECTTAISLKLVAKQLPTNCISEKLQRRCANLCNKIAYALERAGEYGSALQLYQQSHLPPSRERQIRLLEKQQNYSAAWNLLSTLLETPLNEHERQVATRIAARLAKKLDLTFDKKPLMTTASQQLVLTKPVDQQGNFLRVEEAVRLRLDDVNSPCVYAENALLCSLFGLWLWPEMFRGIEGAFANPFQAAPLDIYHENFVAKRPGISTLWSQLESEQYRQILQQTWENKFGVTNYLVNWSFLSRDILDIALHCIPANHLKIIFKRLLFDIRNNRSGLPDLIQFFPAQASYRMVEVKGPGDRIQDNQQRWLDYFVNQHIPAEVCYVSWN